MVVAEEAWASCDLNQCCRHHTRGAPSCASSPDVSSFWLAHFRISSIVRAEWMRLWTQCNGNVTMVCFLTRLGRKQGGPSIPSRKGQLRILLVLYIHEHCAGITKHGPFPNLAWYRANAYPMYTVIIIMTSRCILD